MIILGLTGPLCSGKKTVAEYLQICYAFKLLDLESSKWDLEANHSKDDYSSEEEYREANARTAIKHIQANSSHNYVVYPFTLQEELCVFRLKANFMLVGIDAPSLKRFGFYNMKYLKRKSPLSSFLEVDDKINFGINGYPAQVYECMYSAQKIVQNFGDKEELYKQLRALDVLNPEHLRPSWDTYFIRLAEMAASRSNCMKRAVGAVLVKEKRVVSTGYNGTPSGTLNCNEGGCDRCNNLAEGGTALEDCMCMHAELNALILAGRGHSEESTIYTTLFPCLLCTKAIVQAGVQKIVYIEDYEHVELSRELATQAGLEVLKHLPQIPNDF